jgi:hypothetical protein
MPSNGGGGGGAAGCANALPGFRNKEIAKATVVNTMPITVGA